MRPRIFPARATTFPVCYCYYCRLRLRRLSLSSIAVVPRRPLHQSYQVHRKSNRFSTGKMCNLLLIPIQNGVYGLEQRKKSRPPESICERRITKRPLKTSQVFHTVCKMHITVSPCISLRYLIIPPFHWSVLETRPNFYRDNKKFPREPRLPCLRLLVQSLLLLSQSKVRRNLIPPQPPSTHQHDRKPPSFPII